MKKLIADSGSTKTDWRLIDDKTGLHSFQTTGINPFFRTSENIFQELNKKIFPEIDRNIDEIFFYGAGVVNPEKGDVVKNALLKLFPNARIETHSDILGASRALFGTQPGIACILGTGSNTCLYDGRKITKRILPLGFILGDECSGADLGKKLIGDYFKQVMPSELRILFKRQFTVNQDDILNHTYRMERPNKYLAGFAPFLSQHINDPYCQQLLKNKLADFFERNVLKLPNVLSFDIGFVGSVAFYFSNMIENVARSYGFKQQIILKEPISGLVEYHKN